MIPLNWPHCPCTQSPPLAVSDCSVYYLQDALHQLIKLTLTAAPSLTTSTTTKDINIKVMGTPSPSRSLPSHKHSSDLDKYHCVFIIVNLKSPI